MPIAATRGSCQARPCEEAANRSHARKLPIAATSVGVGAWLQAARQLSSAATVHVSGGVAEGGEVAAERIVVGLGA